MSVQNITSKFQIDDSDLAKLDAKFDGLITKQKTLEKQVTEVSQEFNKAGKSAESFGKETDKATKKASQSLKDTDKQTGLLGRSFQTLGGILAGVFAVDKILEFGKHVVNLTAEFQKMEAVLTNSLGSSSAAQRAMSMIADFAAKTPYSVNELTEAYVKLASRGIRATSKELESIGDLAAASGKSFDQLTEAILDSLSGENERLKEFGVIAQKTGETTQYTFKGVTTEVKNTREAILEYMVSLGQVEGVTGSMNSISETLTGQISNLGDSFDQLFLTLGQQQSGIFSNTIKLVNDLTQGLTTLISTTDQLGEKMAAKGVSDFAVKIENDLKALAAKTKTAGGDVDQVLTGQAESLKKGLAIKLKSAEAELDKFRDEQGIMSKAGELLDLSGRQAYIRKTTESALAYAVADTKGKISAINDALRESLKEGPIEKAFGGTKKPKAVKKLPDVALPSFGEIIDPLMNDEPWDLLIKHYEEVEKKATDTPQKALEYYNKMFGIEMPSIIDKFTDSELEAMDERRKKFEETEQAKLEYRKRCEEEAVSFAITSANAYMDFRSQQLSDEMGMIQALKEGELTLAGDNAAARAQIEQDYALKEAEIRRKQAVNDRNQALFNIAVNTAQGIMSVLSTGGGTRYADFGISAGILTALVAATGAVQAGMVLARPLPQFFKGTESSPEGFAWVGERGSEGKITPDGRFSMIPAGAHVDYLEKGTKIIPNHKLSDFVNKEINTPNVSMADSYNSGINIKELGQEIGTQLSKVTVQQDIYDEKGYRSFVRSQNQRKERLERKNRFNRSI